MSEDPASDTRASGLDRLLRLFGDVRPGEGVTTLLLMANVFLILAGYYICKTVREPLILAHGGAEVKSYASAVMALLLMGFVPLYSWFASRVDRTRLITGVMLFFILDLELFWFWGRSGLPYLGFAFFVWVGIFNNAAVAQFWSYGNDLFSPETGQRLFPVIGIGATLGSPVGSRLAQALFEGGVRAYEMLQITVLLLLASLALFWVVDRRERARRVRDVGRGDAQIERGANGFRLLLASPYLRLIALLLLILNFVNTTGEYILGSAAIRAAAARAAVDPGFDTEAFLGAFSGSYLTYVNLLAVALQALVAARLVRLAGIAGLLFALPVVALGAYGTILAGATFAVVRWAKTAENATDYSIMNTAKQMLWLPTSRQEKYKAKQAVDTFVVRAGDVLSAALVYAGTVWLGFRKGGAGFVGANLLLITVWLGIAWLLLREYRRLSAIRQAAVA